MGPVFYTVSGEIKSVGGGGDRSLRTELGPKIEAF